VTAIGSSRLTPLLDKATLLAPARKVPRGAGRRERSLTENLSLTDAWKFVPESLGVLGLIRVGQVWLTDGHAGPGGMPHPFWIPVLLMSGQYGIMGGLFAALATTAVFFVVDLPVQSATQDFYAYAGVVAAQPCAWFGTALVLGGLRTLHMHHEADLQERFEQTGLMAEDLADGLKQAVDEIERLEHRIATDHDTLAALLDSLAKLEVTDRRSLLISVADVIRFGVGATSFAVWLKGPRGLEPCIGIVDGLSVTPAAIPPLPAGPSGDRRPDVDEERPTAYLHGAMREPLWAPVGLADADVYGVVVCTRLHPSQDPAIAHRRLNEICRVLAVLLTACPAPASEAN
jgi:hypothetical protein